MRRSLSIAVLALVLVGCNGGDGGTTTTETVPPPSTTNDVRVYFLLDGKVWPVLREVPVIHVRTNSQSFCDSHRSATPSNWNMNMYQDRVSCSYVASRNIAGWPTESAVRLSARSGIADAVTHAVAAPQS